MSDPKQQIKNASALAPQTHGHVHHVVADRGDLTAFLLEIFPS
jgi:hypothetical protein